MNIKEIKEMINVMKENDITEFELERNGFKVVLKRGQTVITTPAQQEIILSKPLESPKETLPEAEKKEEQLKENIKEILSPMVGTFYRAPSPESPPYIQKGKTVDPDDVLCIIEAMKVMNEIKAEMSGKIVDILVENGESVEFNQPIFRIEI